MIRGQKRALDKRPSVNVNLNASIHNRFDIEVVDAKTGEVKQRAQAENVICTAYWTNLFYSAGKYNFYIAYGDGNGAPSQTDSSLFNKIGVKSLSSFVGTKDSDDLYHFTANAQLGETENVGSTLTEVGISFVSNGSTIATHAMLKDMNGNQISIVKTDTDVINLYATVFLHFNTQSMLGVTFTASSEKYLLEFMSGIAGVGIFLRPSSFYWDTYVSGYNGALVGVTSFTQTEYPSSENKKVTFTVPRMAVSQGNVDGGITKIILRGRYSSNYENINIPVTSAWYSGSNIVGEAIGTGDGVTTKFATDFIHATNATVYVDGIAKSDVTVSDLGEVANNIVFNTPPPSGSVITADYHTSVIAKDSNHVFDFSITFNFGEYTE